jgi:hypothetical protein
MEFKLHVLYINYAGGVLSPLEIPVVVRRHDAAGPKGLVFDTMLEYLFSNLSLFSLPSLEAIQE